METLGNIYGNRSRHVTRSVKLTETLNWESLFIPSWFSNYQSMNSSVGVNPHGSTEKVKLLLNSSHLEPQAVKPPHHAGTTTRSSRSLASRETPSSHTWRAKYRSGFMTLLPKPLQELPIVVLLWGRHLASWLIALGECGGHGDLRSLGRLSVIPYVRVRTELYCAQACLV
jgi:hypothetical protein